MGGIKIVNQKKKLIIISITALLSFILFIVIISVIYVTFFQPKNKDTGKLEKYTDPGSGEVIYSGMNKTVEKSTIEESNEIIYLGFNKLTDIGLSKTQLDKLKSFFRYYKTHKQPDLKEVSVTVSTINHRIVRNQNGGIGKNITTFQITVNRKNKFNIETNYDQIYNISIKLFNDDSTKLIFSSDEIPRG